VGQALGDQGFAATAQAVDEREFGLAQQRTQFVAAVAAASAAEAHDLLVIWHVDRFVWVSSGVLSNTRPPEGGFDFNWVLVSSISHPSTEHPTDRPGRYETDGDQCRAADHRSDEVDVPTVEPRELR
jgi:hypothetical protein